MWFIFKDCVRCYLELYLFMVTMILRVSLISKLNNLEFVVTIFFRNALQGIIVQRIGMDHFLNRLDQLRRTDMFMKSEQGKVTVTTK
jgi:hypothetical protein